ncbi:MAG: serine hydrolase domain-containing protein [Sediminibacterium sp.]
MLKRMIIPFLSVLLLACGSPAPSPAKDSIIKKSDPVTYRLSEKEKAYYNNKIELLYNTSLKRTGFNGSILLAKKGEIVFEDYRGLINFKTKEAITANSTFHLASVSKTFTATVILHLMEQGKINLEDAVEKYLPNFPYHNITIKNLLTHRSGLPKYDHFMDGTRTEVVMVKNKKGKMIKRLRTFKVPIAVSGLLSNQALLAYMVQYKPAMESMPDRRYSYCNTNYSMLALIVEKITQKTFPNYMRDSVFSKLGMTNSFVFSIKDTANYVPSYNYNNSPFKLEKLDCIYGDKNVYSTVRDLLKWDQALYEGKFVSLETMNMAYQPYSHEKKGQKNYGLGWHLYINPPDPTVVYHNGWWHGNNTVFKRLISDSATVIILGNKFNRSIWAAGKMSSVFTGRPDTTQLEQ